MLCFALFAVLSVAQVQYPYRSVVASSLEEFPFLSSRFNSHFSIDSQSLTVTMPLYEGLLSMCTDHLGKTRDGPVWFIITEASTREMSELLEVNYAPSLAFITASGKNGFRESTFEEGRLTFASGYYVDFQPERELKSDEVIFPPSTARPGSVAENTYSPIVRLPDGTFFLFEILKESGSFINAPIIAKVGAQEDLLIKSDSSILHDRFQFSLSSYQKSGLFRYSQ